MARVILSIQCQDQNNQKLIGSTSKTLLSENYFNPGDLVSGLEQFLIDYLQFFNENGFFPQVDFCPPEIGDEDKETSDVS